MPGSPPSRVAEPATMPPPNTRSSSPIPVATALAGVTSTSAIGCGPAAGDAPTTLSGSLSEYAALGRRDQPAAPFRSASEVIEEREARRAAYRSPLLDALGGPPNWGGSPWD